MDSAISPKWRVASLGQIKAILTISDKEQRAFLPGSRSMTGEPALEVDF
jgi:hypothetical protein